MEDGGKEPFSELNRILDSLKQRDLGPALEWAQSHRESLDTQVKRFISTAIVQHTIQNVFCTFHVVVVVVSFMTLSVSQDCVVSDGRSLVNNQLERSICCLVKAVSLEGLGKQQKTCQDSLCSSQESNPESSKYRSRALPLY